MEAEPPCFEHLEVVLDSIPRAGAFNMALDEVLLASTGSNVVLRMYDWVKPTVSFGYFQSVEEARRLAKGREIVRRWTGGGIVEHGRDFTYSLRVPRLSRFTALRSIESYRRIHAAVARALRVCGARAGARPELATISTDAPGGNVCFDRPVLHDLIAHGKKIAGAAQRRSRTGILHQGSIQIETSGTSDHAFWKHDMARELPRTLAFGCHARVLTPEELARADELTRSKYATAEWTNRV